MRLLVEIALSIYFPLLLIVGNAAISVQHPATNSWVDDLQLLIKSGSSHFTFVFLWAISAAVLFVCFRMLARLLVMEGLLRIVGGIVFVAGFPFLSGYISFRGYFRIFDSVARAVLYAYVPERWLAFEVAGSLVCVLLYSFRKWPLEAWWGLLLLGVHFAIWAWFIGGSQFLQVFPALGFVSSFAWELYVRPIGAGHSIAQASAAP